jgi:cytoskeletal protein CcmA (bactofilin family)
MLSTTTFTSSAPISPWTAANGDVIAGNRITLNGDVNGNAIIAGQTERAGWAWRVAASAVDINNAISGDLIAAASQVISYVAVQSGDLLVAAATVQVDARWPGRPRNAGRLIINSDVGGNVNITGDEVRLEPAASIAGNLTYESKTAEQA